MRALAKLCALGVLAAASGRGLRGVSSTVSIEPCMQQLLMTRLHALSTANITQHCEHNIFGVVLSCGHMLIQPEAGTQLI
jgi:hypothetical protein